MKRLTLGLAFLLIVLLGFSQSGADSIRKNYSGDCPAELYNQLFDYYLMTNDRMAECYADSLLTYAQVNNSPYYEAIAYWAKGNWNYKIGNCELAAYCYEKSEPIAIEIGDAFLLYLIYNELGNIFIDKDENEQAKKYFRLAIDYAKLIENNEAYATAMANMAGIYNNNEEYEAALKIYDSVLNITNDINTRIAIYCNIANVQSNAGMMDEAKGTYATLVSMIDESTDMYIYLSVLNKLSYLYIIEKDYAKAKEYLAKVDSLSSINSYGDIRLTMYQHYHDLYVKIGDYELSEYYSEKLFLLQDSLIEIDNTNKLNELETHNLLERNELEMKRRDEKIHFQKTLNLILCVVVVLVLIFVVVIAVMLVRKNRMNKMLNQLNIDLKQRDEEIMSNLQYAREIQLGCMNDGISLCGLDMFVLDRPKTIVGGDFHIALSRGGVSYVAVGDCTGHGISGGFLSVLGIKSVYAAIEKYDNLPDMADFINKEFWGIVSSAENLKGESLCLSLLKISDGELRFLGSKQKMWKISNGELYEYKSSCAIMGSSESVDFSEEIMTVASGDVVFLSSDGYPDQFGPDGKLKYSRFRNLLFESSNMNPDDAKSFLSQKLDEWRGENEQTDDVMVLGIYF